MFSRASLVATAVLVLVAAVAVSAQSKDDPLADLKAVGFTKRDILGGFEDGDKRNPYRVPQMYGSPTDGKDKAAEKNRKMMSRDWKVDVPVCCEKGPAPPGKGSLSPRTNTTGTSGKTGGASVIGKLEGNATVVKPAPVFTIDSVLRSFDSRVHFKAGPNNTQVFDFGGLAVGDVKENPDGFKEEFKNFPEAWGQLQKDLTNLGASVKLRTKPKFFVAGESPTLSAKGEETARQRAMSTACYLANYLRKNGVTDFTIHVGSKMPLAGKPVPTPQKKSELKEVTKKPGFFGRLKNAAVGAVKGLKQGAIDGAKQESKIGNKIKSAFVNGGKGAIKGAKEGWNKASAQVKQEATAVNMLLTTAKSRRAEIFFGASPHRKNFKQIVIFRSGSFVKKGGKAPSLKDLIDKLKSRVKKPIIRLKALGELALKTMVGKKPASPQEMARRAKRKLDREKRRRERKARRAKEKKAREAKRMEKLKKKEARELERIKRRQERLRIQKMKDFEKKQQMAIEKEKQQTEKDQARLQQQQQQQPQQQGGQQQLQQLQQLQQQQGGGQQLQQLQRQQQQFGNRMQQQMRFLEVSSQKQKFIGKMLRRAGSAVVNGVKSVGRAAKAGFNAARDSLSADAARRREKRMKEKAERKKKEEAARAERRKKKAERRAKRKARRLERLARRNQRKAARLAARQKKQAANLANKNKGILGRIKNAAQYARDKFNAKKKWLKQIEDRAKSQLATWTKANNLKTDGGLEEKCFDPKTAIKWKKEGFQGAWLVYKPTSAKF